MNDKKAETTVKKELVSQAEIAKEKTTLKIWAVPTDTAEKFISAAKRKYEGKSWMYLKNLMEKEVDFELMKTKIDLIDNRLKNMENYLETIARALSEEESSAPAAESQEDEKTVKTFGGNTLEKKGGKS